MKILIGIFWIILWVLLAPKCVYENLVWWFTTCFFYGNAVRYWLDYFWGDN